jgi:hypothetical protein
MTRCVRWTEAGEEGCRLAKTADLSLGVVQLPGPPLDACPEDAVNGRSSSEETRMHGTRA